MPELDRLCVVLPCAAGETAWQPLLDQLSTLPPAAEVILSGVTGAAARALRPQPSGAPPHGPEPRWVEGSAGRAAQQNRGAAAGSNPWLWFLHADSRLHPRCLERIAALPERDCLAYFDLAFHDGGAAMQLNRCGAFIRSRWLGMPFGDQGLLLPRRLFQRLGGFDERLGAGEDHALVWAARRAGIALHPLRLPLYTSARRYREHGWWRTTARHLWLSWVQARRFSRGLA